MGLDHSSDPNSPMFEHGIPSSVTPTADDIADLRELYGVDPGNGGNREQEESDEDDADNNDFETAVALNPTEGYPKRRFQFSAASLVQATWITTGFKGTRMSEPSLR